MPKDAIAQRIFTLVDAQFDEQRDFAVAIGVKPSIVSQWRNDITTSYTRRIDAIAAVLGTTTDYLLKGVASATSAPVALTVPVLGDVAAGIPIEAITDIVDYEELDAALAGSGEYFGLRIKGDSMMPRMMPGDVVIVRKQEDIESGDVAVVMVNGDSATVKRVKKGPNGITLIPFNPVYGSMEYSNADIEALPVRILGKVVELRAKF